MFHSFDQLLNECTICLAHGVSCKRMICRRCIQICFHAKFPVYFFEMMKSSVYLFYCSPPSSFETHQYCFFIIHHHKNIAFFLKMMRQKLTSKITSRIDAGTRFRRMLICSQGIRKGRHQNIQLNIKLQMPCLTQQMFLYFSVHTSMRNFMMDIPGILMMIGFNIRQFFLYNFFKIMNCERVMCMQAYRKTEIRKMLFSEQNNILINSF